jgi:hypothetical protein
VSIEKYYLERWIPVFSSFEREKEDFGLTFEIRKLLNRLYMPDRDKESKVSFGKA